MCGIVMVGSKSMSSADVGRFEKLLYCDVFRGPHSTGVFTQRQYGIGKQQQDPQVDIFKDNVEAAYFLDSNGWEECKNGTEKTAKLGNLYVGHNRYATMGAKTAKNAHPFNHGAITLVHNGTLTRQHLLPDHNRFAVDSENICHSINKIGAAETIQKLDGAFTLVWFDSSDQTLHIIRNDERPFHLAETATGDWYGASEEEMLMWILKRGKWNPSIKRHFETEVGIEYIFDAAPGKFSLKEEVKHELPTFRYTYTAPKNRYTSTCFTSSPRGANDAKNTVLGQGLANQRHTSSNKGDDKYKACNDLLEAHGVGKKHGDFIDFTAHHFGEYTSKNGMGMMEGYLGFLDEYVEIQSHQTDGKDYKPYAEMTARIIGAFHDNGVLTVITTAAKLQGSEPTVLMPEPTDVDDDYAMAMSQAQLEAEENEAAASINMLNGDSYTQEEWEKSGHSQCGCCSSPLSIIEASSLEWYNGEPICATCHEDIYAELAEEEHIRKQEEDENVDWEQRDFVFNCHCCGKPTHLDDEGKLAGHCASCSPIRETLALPKKKELPSHCRCGKKLISQSFKHNDEVMCSQCWSEAKAEEDRIQSENKPRPTKSQRELTDGRVVNRKQWSKMNKCDCGVAVHFKDSPKTLILQGRVICKDCEAKLI